MPALNFKKQFVPKILDGSKPHTIRRRRKSPIKVGDMLSLYTGMRTKNCRLIGKAPCVKVQPVVIEPIGMDMYYLVDGILVMLSPGEINELAFRDGFENVFEFFDFFEQYLEPGGSIFEQLDDFEIIWWDPKKLEVNE